MNRAITFYQRTLICCERVLGGDHPNTLTTRNNLASADEAAGDPGRAIPLHQQRLADCERVLGGDHPTTLASRTCVAAPQHARRECRPHLLVSNICSSGYWSGSHPNGSVR
ncbi:tetratricopeptide repeat protein [Spirillospora sp. NPDC048819]|uniref:tetratricopeptide repeat protein n=1 Tax=Spirillospora sp. NPDC048819 TaxID=3155268 RepID=UPI0033D7609A